MSDEEVERKAGTIRMKHHQIEIILDAIEKNPRMDRCKFDKSYTCHSRLNDWRKLVKLLNSSGGAVKKVVGWQKTWTDKKRAVKRKHNQLCAERQKTGQVEHWKLLTPQEERILKFVTLDEALELDVEDSKLWHNGFLVLQDISIGFQALQDRTSVVSASFDFQTENMECTPETSSVDHNKLDVAQAKKNTELNMECLPETSSVGDNKLHTAQAIKNTELNMECLPETSSVGDNKLDTAQAKKNTELNMECLPETSSVGDKKLDTAQAIKNTELNMECLPETSSGDDNKLDTAQVTKNIDLLSPSPPMRGKRKKSCSKKY